MEKDSERVDLGAIVQETERLRVLRAEYQSSSRWLEIVCGGHKEQTSKVPRVWRPQVFSDLDSAMGVVAESADLEFKRELSKPRDIAKDIAAMSIQGGVIAYGIDEDAQTLVAREITPIPLHQVPDKIQNIVDTAIWPALSIDIQVLKREPGDNDGVVIVTVPPSPLAPHYTHDRFPARSGTTTRNLTEHEISSMYEQRRAALASGDESEILADFIHPADAPPAGVGFQGIGVLRLLVSPLVPARHPEGVRLAPSLEGAVASASDRAAPLVPITLTVAFDLMNAWTPRGAVGWQAGVTYDNFEQLRGVRTSAAVCTHELKMCFYATMELSAEGGAGKLAFEHLWAAETIALLSVAGSFLREVSAASILRVELGLDGLEGALASATNQGSVLDSPQLRATGGYMERTRSSSIELVGDPETVARRLLDRFFVSFVPQNSDTFVRLRSTV